MPRAKLKPNPIQAQVDALMADAVQSWRPPRSEPYRSGCRALLQHKLSGDDLQPCPHAGGSAECDAWYAGVSEGHSIVRRAAEVTR